MHRKNVKMWSAVLLLATWIMAHPVFAQTYTATPIDRLTWGYALNDSGWIGGYTLDDSMRHPSYTNLYLGVIAHINYAGGAQAGYINALNRGALGAGFIFPAGRGAAHAALFTYDGQSTILETDHDYSEAYAINDQAWVVGSLRLAGRYKAFLWKPNLPLPGSAALPDILHGTLEYLSCPDETPGFARWGGKALTINRDGLIGGYCGNSPYIWWNGVGYDISSWLPTTVTSAERLIDRASAGFTCEVSSIADSYAFAVSCDSGRYLEITNAATSYVSTPYEPRLTQVAPGGIYAPGTGMFTSGGIYATSIRSINNRGCAVGQGRIRPVTYIAIAYCSDSGITNLNGAIFGGSGYEFTHALAINNDGQILVELEHSGEPGPFYRGNFLLTER